MAKRRTKTFRTKFGNGKTAFPNHHVVVDQKSRRLIGKGLCIAKAWKRLDAIASKLLGIHRPKDGFESLPVHSVDDDRVPIEQIGRVDRLVPTWHGRA